MSKRIKVRLAIIAVLVVLITIPAAMAYMYVKTETIDNEFIPAQVSCKVIENMEENTKTSIQVENTSNVPVYIRLKVITYWQDSKGNIVGKFDNPKMVFNYDKEKWYCVDDTLDNPTNGDLYYYRSSVPATAGASTTNLFASGNTITLDTLTETVTNNGATVTYHYYQVVEFIAEAIQAEPTKAVEESWGVTITDGKITGLK